MWATTTDASVATATSTQQHHQPQQQQTVDSDEGSRVGVQLVVFGIAAVAVVGVGGAAYLLRRKLGRTAYDPAKAAAEQGH